jgi:uncharacterized protein (DUF2336 family)
MSMNSQTGLIYELEDILASKYVSRRVEILQRVTDLFVVGSGKFSEEHVELFDHVMSKLIENVATAARAQFGSRLATLADAPPNVIHHLASDDAIEVAGPVLRQSERIDEQALVETARTKSHDHLLAISGRRTLPEVVTDVLVDRGDSTVVSSTAKNSGARFSDSGFSALVEKARDDGDLALSVWSRPDIPRQNLVKLFVEASEAVKSQLITADPEGAELIKTAVAEAADRIQTKARARSDDFAQAKSFVGSLYSSGQLNEAQLHAFASEKSFDKVTVAMSLMCNLPLQLIERAFVQKEPDQLLILARAMDLSWVTTVALLLLQTSVSGGSRQQLDQCFASFSRLQPKTAQAAIQSYRTKEKAAG